MSLCYCNGTASYVDCNLIGRGFHLLTAHALENLMSHNETIDLTLKRLMSLSDHALLKLPGMSTRKITDLRAYQYFRSDGGAIITEPGHTIFSGYLSRFHP